MSKHKNPHEGTTWEELRKELFTPQERAASDLRVALICELVEARNKEGLTQAQLEKISSVRQPIIARLEKGTTDPRLSTICKLLASLGKTLKIVPLER